MIQTQNSISQVTKQHTHTETKQKKMDFSKFNSHVESNHLLVFEPNSPKPILIKKSKQSLSEGKENAASQPASKGRKSKNATTTTALKNDPSLANLTEEERKAEINKRSAQASRERKRELKEYLEKRSLELKAQSSQLDLNIREAETENRVLNEELNQLKNMLQGVSQVIQFYSMSQSFSQQQVSSSLPLSLSGPPSVMGH